MDIGWPEIAIIAVVVLVLFGSKKLPDAARSLGRSMRIMKTEIKGLHDDDDKDATPVELPVVAPVVAPVAPPVAAPVVTTTPAEPVSAGDQTPAP
jgi:sec-independent protein translocase protein TatA